MTEKTKNPQGATNEGINIDINNNITPPKTTKNQENQDFLNNDFKKSGIRQEVINKYIQNDLLISTDTGWELYYPELTNNAKSDYYTTRLKNPTTNAKYIKPEGQQSRLFRPLHLSPDSLLNSSECIIITEGEKKAIKAVQEGFNCVSLAGVWCWKTNFDKETEQESECGIINDIKELNLKGKIVGLCFDADLWEKEQVKTALYSLACYFISEKKAKVKIIMLPKGKEKGIDDYLIAYGRDSFQKLMDDAKEYSLKDIQEILSGNNKNLNFPINIFKNDIREFITDLKIRLDAPIEYLASTFLTGASILMDGKYSIMIDKNKNWVDYPVLWAALIGNPSQKKTPCLNIFKTIIDEFQAELTEKYEAELEKYREDFTNYKIDMKQYEQQRINNKTIPMPLKPEEPCRELITSQSITVEALAKALSKNNSRSLAIWVDELASLLNGMGQYKNKGGNDIEYFLQAWKKQSYNVLRSNQENSYTVLASHNIIGGIQPKVLTKTLFNNKFESSNGMIERWLYVCSDYEETGNEYNSNIPYNNALIKNIYEKIFRTNKEFQCHFSADAQTIFNRFCKKIILEKKKNITDLTKSYIQKQTDYVARFSLILHCINNDSGNEISEKTVSGAIALSMYFISCFEKISQQNCDFNPLEPQTLDYLRIKGLKSISPSKLHKSNTSRYKTVESAKHTLETLANKGYGRLQKVKNGGINFIYYS